MTKPAELSPEYAELLRQDASKSVSQPSQDFDDLSRPFLRILQLNSPECSKRDIKYIEGAEPGHWYMKNAPNPIVSGTEGIKVVPVLMAHAWIEFLPDRGGFVERHSQQPDDLVRVSTGSRRQQFERRSTHNVVEQAREFLLLIDGQACLFSCTSTLHQFARDLQTHFHHVRLPGANADFVPPIYAHQYLWTTISRSNNLGSWFFPKSTDLGLVPLADYKLARALAVEFAPRPELPGADVLRLPKSSVA